MGRGERYKVNIRKEQRFHLEKMHESSTHTHRAVVGVINKLSLMWVIDKNFAQYHRECQGLED